MADEDPYIAPLKPAVPLPRINKNPNKFYVHFMYKAAVVAAFVVFLPLLPSQAPEFINQTLHTRSWEFLQLLFVGIAVSYGLFSRKNEEAEKDHSSKFDSAHTYVSRFLEVSSVFEDEADNSSGPEDNSKVQTWNSQYYREKPRVVVAQEGSLIEDRRRIRSGANEKPLLLPVRSLKSRVSDWDFTLEAKELSGTLRRSSSFSTSRRASDGLDQARNGQFGGSGPPNAEENVVLRSPIPWRSRSGRMEMKVEMDGIPSYSLPSPMEESNPRPFESNSYRPQNTRSPRPSSTPPTPNKLSPSPSLSPPKKLPPSPKISTESRTKNVAEEARRNVYYRTTPPPPPPPPPQPLYSRKPPIVKSNSTLSSSESASGKELKRTVRSLPSYPKEPEVVLGRVNSGAESKKKVTSDGSLAGKSVRTVRAVESVASVEASYPHMSEAAFRGYEREEFDESEGSEDESEIEKEEVVEEEEASPTSGGEGGPDVNQKADEFIAKFREQIRLQRIESIKRSTAQIARNSSR